ncbi:MAG: hypothetical protein KJ600_02065 [Nanoarchaeota archaeon]|nr:hypothetical protein [Nanoarchaeota archaeon]MBU1103322.1 hypothetical protein [Nanoarchaeota archaeon]
MALEDVITTEDVFNASTEIAARIGSIGKWLQAIGIIVIVWIALQVVNWIFNKKRIKRLDLLRGDMERIEKKVDKLLKK